LKKYNKIQEKGGCKFLEVQTKYSGHAKYYMKEYESNKLKEVTPYSYNIIKVS